MSKSKRNKAKKKKPIMIAGRKFYPTKKHGWWTGPKKGEVQYHIMNTSGRNYYSGKGYAYFFKRGERCYWGREWKYLDECIQDLEPWLH